MTEAQARTDAQPAPLLRQPKRAPGWTGWLLRLLNATLWLAGTAFALLIAGAVALWLWASTPMALPQTLHWAQTWLKDPETGLSPLLVEGAHGSLTRGGEIERLAWRDTELELELQAVRLRWAPRLWLDLALERTLRIEALDIGLLRGQPHEVTEDEPPLSPPEHLKLPWLKSVDIPLQLQRLRWDDAPAMEAGPLSARYRYTEDDGHVLKVSALVWQTGSYQIEVKLQAAAPLAVQAQLLATVATPATPDLPAQKLALSASVQGQLAGADAKLQARADIRPEGQPPARGLRPNLQLDAVIMPWATLPLERATLALQDINLAHFWPAGPVTRLHGRWQAGPLDDAAAGQRWQVQGELSNRLARPWNEKGLPMDRLQAHAILAPERWQLLDLRLALGSGRMHAEGAIDWGAPAATQSWWQKWSSAHGRLTLRGLDVRQVLSTLPAARISAQAQAAQERGLTAWRLQASPDASSGTPGGTAQAALPTLRSRGTWSGADIVVQALQADWRGSRLQGAATVRGGKRWSTQAELQWQAPGIEAELSAHWPWSAASARLDAQLADAQRFQRWSQDAVQAIDAWHPKAGLRQKADWWWATQWQGQAKVQAQAQGSQGAHGWPANWEISADVPTLALNWTEAAATGLQSLAWSDTRVQAQGTGQHWSALIDTRSLATWPHAPWELAALLQASGTWETSPQGPSHRVRWETTRLQGGRQDSALHWRGELAAPTELLISPAGDFTLQAGRWTMQPVLRAGHALPTVAQEPALIQWKPARWSKGVLQTQGQVGPIPLSWANAWLASPDSPLGPMHAAGITGDMWFDGSWDIALPLTHAAAQGQHRAPARAQLLWQHRRGDLQYNASSAVGATTFNSGIEALALKANLRATALDLDLTLQTRQLGAARGQLATQLRPPGPDQSWTWAQDAPINGNWRVNLPQLGLLAPLLPPGWHLDGVIASDARLSGTRAQPQWDGQLEVQGLALRSVLDGIDFSDGQLLARLAGDRVLLERLQLRGAGGAAGGLLSGQGEMAWQPSPDGGAKPRLELRLKAEKLRLLARADQRLTLSGDLSASLQEQLLDLSARLRVDQGLILLPDDVSPSLGSDVVVRGQTAPLPLSARLPWQVRLRMDMDLGPDLEVRAMGLQTWLEGALRVEAQAGQLTPAVFGEVKTVRGSYRAFGQRLQIEHGRLSFNGAHDNPALDILALRPHPSQRVGVAVTGTALAPSIRLYSDPDLPDSEKLAWLILGRPATGAGAQAAILQQAALALLMPAQSERDGTVAQRLGLDEMAFQGETVAPDGTAIGAALTLGKRFSDQLYVSYTRSVTGAVGTVAVFLDLTRFLTLRGQAGDDNAIDLIFTRRFDHWRTNRTIEPRSP